MDIMLLFAVGSIALILTTDAYPCQYCPARLVTETCNVFLECGQDVGCYSWTWTNNGLRYYQKGCQTSVVDCYDTVESFCTRDNAAICCETGLCNVLDPVLVWRPNNPRNLVVKQRTSTSVTLGWDLQCNGAYTYQVDYFKEEEQQATVIANVTGQEVTVSGLTSGAMYRFFVRSVHEGLYSISSTIVQSTQNESAANVVLCGITLNSTLFNFNSTTIQQCPPSQQSCITTLHYPANGGQTYVTRNCVSTAFCATTADANMQLCKPGNAGHLCHFCCDSVSCNLNTSIGEGLICDGGSSRVECGWEGIDRDACSSRGCCYQQTTSSNYDKWCFHKTYGTGEPPLAVGGFNTWLIIVIVLAIILLILIIVLLVYCIYSRKKKQQSASYDCDAVYATPNKSRSRNMRTIAGLGRSNPAMTVEESP